MPTSEPTYKSCLKCPYGIKQAVITPVSLQDCPEMESTAIPSMKHINIKGNYWRKRDQRSSSEGSWDRRRLLAESEDHSYSMSESDDGTGAGYDHESDVVMFWEERCLAPHGERLIFRNDLCQTDQNMWHSVGDDDYLHAVAWIRNLKSKRDGFLAPVCVSYFFENFMDEARADCGKVESVFLGLCENGDTDFDSGLLGIGDLDLIIDPHTFVDGNNVEQAYGDRLEDGKLGIRVILKEKHDFMVCFVNVTVTTQFNQTVGNDNDGLGLEMGHGILNYVNLDGQNQSCSVDGLPCLS